MLDNMRWIIEQLEGIKAALWETYDIHHTQTMFKAIDNVDSAIDELETVIEEMETNKPQ